MVDDDLFAKLERLNAQIDVWIDEENFSDVEKTFSTDFDSEFPDLSKAFSHRTCASKNQDAWGKILGDPPGRQWITYLLLTPDGISPDRERTNRISTEWNHLFWAKWIRAKIQEQGTDCYLARLDHVIAYLERYMPQFDPSSPGAHEAQQEPLHRKKLVVLYLLEMAAAGFGPDHRSFAQRAKRYLKQILADYPREKDFKSFYDLVAEYHMAVGYFHEKEPEKGEAACAKIIQGLKHLCPDPENLRGGEEPSQSYADARRARDLLYIPAVLSIAEARAKQQLAHSAIEFIEEWLNSEESARPFQKTRKYITRAEAYLQMESMHRFDGEMQHFVDSLIPNEKVPPGIGSKVVPLMLEYSMQSMRRAHEQVTREYKSELSSDAKKKIFDNFEKTLEDHHRDAAFFEQYWEITENRKEDRQGFLTQLAQYCKMLVKEISKDTWADKDYKDQWEKHKSDYREKAKELYRYRCRHKGSEACKSKGKCTYNDNGGNCRDKDKWSNKLLPQPPRPDSDGESSAYKCPCEEDRKIDLSPAWEGDFIDFQDTMRVFFETANKDLKDDDLRKDEIQFMKAVKDIQKRYYGNLLWLDRKYDIRLRRLEKSGSPIDCSKCLAGTDRNAFAGLLGCAEKCSLCNYVNKLLGRGKNNLNLSAKDYELIMKAWDKYFREHVSVRTSPGVTKNGIHFLGLQRWNSTSPAMGLSRGGGYFIYVTGNNGEVELGIAVDPGFNFVENLLHCGFSIADVHIVVLSHSHLDHLRDFESLVSLCFEAKKRTKEKQRHRLHTVMTFGTYDRLGHLFRSPELRDFIEPYIIDVDKRLHEELDKPLPVFSSFDFRLANGSHYSVSRVEWAPRFDASGNKLGAKITPLRAFHNDHTDISDSFGFRIEITRVDGQPYSIGYTGDTSWKEELMDQYKGCGALLVHLGSLIGSKDGTRRKFSDYKKGGEECYKLMAKENHPYLPGLLHFMGDLRTVSSPPLIMVGEFGEELRGKIRLDLFGRLKEACATFTRVLPVDVGLDVHLDHKADPGDGGKSDTEWDPKVWCVQCEHYVTMDRVDFETYGHDEALFCVCTTCRKSTPHNVLQDRLRRLYEEGRRLPRAPER